MNINSKNPFQTSDLALATAISLWHPVVSLVKNKNTERIEFAFEHSDGIKKLVEQYWRGELLVDPQRYFQQLKIFKSRIHSGL